MNTSKNTQHGFSLVEIIIVLIIVAVVGAVGYLAYAKLSYTGPKDTKADTYKTPGSSQSSANTQSKIKNLGINLDAYDPATGKAGDFKFTKENLQFNRLFFEYGFVVPANSVGAAKSNPQPTFVLPLGTKVHALVDGEVYDTPKLYSGDYSVMVKGEGGELIFETEHVINVKVKKGDKVKAGQVVAEVSDYDARNYGGLGLVEIGVLKGGNPPSHVCPFDYLDDSIKDSTLKKITAFQKSWEEYLGDTSVYDESKVVIPGCITRDPIEG